MTSLKTSINVKYNLLRLQLSLIGEAKSGHLTAFFVLIFSAWLTPIR